jgi:hypothetical protein
MTAARRLAAILAADVVGYSRLMGEDETGTTRAVRPVVAGLRRPHRQDDRRRLLAGVSLRRAAVWSKLHLGGTRPVIASEAKQSRERRGVAFPWIASSLTLLAMTILGRCNLLWRVCRRCGSQRGGGRRITFGSKMAPSMSSSLFMVRSAVAWSTARPRRRRRIATRNSAALVVRLLLGVSA